MEIEKKLLQLKKSINNSKDTKNKKSNFINTRVWTQKRSVYNKHLGFEATRNMKFIEHQNSLFDEISKYIYRTKYKNRNKHIRQKQLEDQAIIKHPKCNEEIIISQKSAKIIKGVYGKIDKLNEKEKELHKTNALSLQKTSSQYFRTSRPKTATIETKQNPKARPVSASTYYSSKIINNNNSKKIKYKINNKNNVYNKEKPIKISNEQKLLDLRNLDLLKFYKERKNISYLKRLNDIYRSELHKAFNVYSSLRHLKDMNNIQLDDISVRQDIQDFKKTINKRISDRCKGKYFKKQYEKFLKMNKINAKIKNKSCDHKHNDSTELNNKLSIGKFKLRVNYSSKNLYNPKLPKDFKDSKIIKKKKNLSQNAIIQQENEILHDVLDKIYHTMDVGSIEDFIDADQKVLRVKGQDHKIKMAQNFKKFFPNFEEIEESMKKIGDNENNKGVGLKQNTKSQLELQECMQNTQNSIKKNNEEVKVN